jgi:hypothetical protein
LACTYAALVLHDDGQDITGTYVFTQEKRSVLSSKLQASTLKDIGPSFSQKLSKDKTSLPFLTLEVQSHRVLLQVKLPNLPQWLRRKLRKKEAKSNRRRRKPLPLPQKRKTWIWATSLVDSLSDK